MSEEQGAPAGVTPQAPNATAAPDGDVAAAPSKRDWAGWAQSNRKALEGIETLAGQFSELQKSIAELKGQSQSKETLKAREAAPDSANPYQAEIASTRAELAGLRRQVALGEFFTQNTVTAKQREIMSSMLAGVDPEKVVDRAREILETFRPAAPAVDTAPAKAPTPPAAPLPKGSSATPAPAMNALAGVMSGDIFGATREQLDALTPQQKRDWFESVNKKGSQNPYAASRAARGK